MCTAAGPDPNPIGGGQLPNPNECNQGYLPLALYIVVDERGHCLRWGSPLTFFPRTTTSGSRMSIMRVRESRFVPRFKIHFHFMITIQFSLFLKISGAICTKSKRKDSPNSSHY